MAEEHKCQSPPEGPRLCANNCGFFGSPATLDLCSKCYRDFRLKEEQASSAKMAVEMAVEKSFLAGNSSTNIPTVTSHPSSVAQSVAAAVEAIVSPVADSPPAVTLEDAVSAAAAAVLDLQPAIADPTPAAAADVAVVQQAPSQPPQPTRCSSCRKRVGLTGFRCRCGETFCGSHRYPEHHSCTFDFKSAGKDAIARANPVVKARKLDKI